MLTSQIGSLPFKEINTAISYAIEFDLPFVATLPQLDENEFMYNLAMSGFNNFDPTPLELCLLPTLELLKGKECKYQVMGPVSLFKCLESQNIKVDKKKLELFLLLKIQNVLRLFDKYNVGPVIFLDEPMIGLEFKDYEFLNEFLAKLNCKIGIHCCGNADINLLDSLKINYVSLDFLNIFKKDLNLIKNLVSNKIIFFGLLSTEFDNCNIISRELSDFVQLNANHFITPTCGLGVSEVELASKLCHQKMNLMFR